MCLGAWGKAGDVWHPPGWGLIPHSGSGLLPEHLACQMEPAVVHPERGFLANLLAFLWPCGMVRGRGEAAWAHL